MNEENKQPDGPQPICEPLIILDHQRGRSYILINGQWLPMSQSMYDDRRLRDAVLQHQQAEIDQAIAENKRMQTELLYRQVIERFNRAHGQNRKITLKQICEQMGVSYDAVRQYRSRERKRKTKK